MNIGRGLKLKPVASRQAQQAAAAAFKYPANEKAALRIKWIEHSKKPKPTVARAMQGGIWKRDKSKDGLYAALGAGAGAVAIGGGIALAARGRTPKPKIPQIPHTKPVGSKVTEELGPITGPSPLNIARQRRISLQRVPSPEPEVPNVVPMTEEQVKVARAINNQRAAAARLLRKKKNAQSAKGDTEADLASRRLTPLERGEQLPNGAGRIKKSYVKVGGKIVTMSPAKMKAKGLMPASHSKMQGVTPKDRRDARDISASWQQVRRMGEGRDMSLMSPMDPPTKTTKHGLRRIKHGDVSAVSPMQNFSATASLPTKNGMQVGSQRQAPAIIAVNRGMSPQQQKDYARHELQHVAVRKPMSRDVRHYRHPEKVWGDEARADSVMSRKSQKRSLYNISSKLGFIPAPKGALPDRYVKGFKNGGRKKYKDVQAKIRNANGEPQVSHTKRNIAFVAGGVGAAGAGTGAAVYYGNKKRVSKGLPVRFRGVTEPTSLSYFGEHRFEAFKRGREASRLIAAARKPASKGTKGKLQGQSPRDRWATPYRADANQKIEAGKWHKEFLKP